MLASGSLNSEFVMDSFQKSFRQERLERFAAFVESRISATRSSWPLEAFLSPDQNALPTRYASNTSNICITCQCESSTHTLRFTTTALNGKRDGSDIQPIAPPAGPPASSDLSRFESLSE